MHHGQLLIQQLKNQGVERMFCIPGESYLAALDGLYQSGIDLIVARHEGAATMMAEADAKLSGQLGVALVTRGPGATNASCGVHIAMQDATPLLLLIGQVHSATRDREAFQEIDYRAMFTPLAKWAAEVQQPERLPEYLSRACHIAQTGRPGPVVLAIPEDVLSARIAANTASTSALPAAVLPGGEASQSDIDVLLDTLQQAEQPLIIVGGGGWSHAAFDALAAFSTQTGIAVATAFRRQDYIDNRHPHYIGDVGIGINPALAERVKSADVLCVLGARLGEITSSAYTLVTPPISQQRLIHIYPDTSELGKVYRPDISILAKPAALIQQLANNTRQIQRRHQHHTEPARQAYLDWQQPQTTPGHIRMEYVVTQLNTLLDDNAILCNGAGNYAAWLHRYYHYRSYRSQLAPTSGSMGYGLPAAIAAKLRYPARDVICWAGDGCLQMVLAEFGTACQYGANVIVLVCNNGRYGTIRMHQERQYPGRVSGTALVNPDFAALAESYGGFGAKVTHDHMFVPTFLQARQAQKPAILDLQVSPDAVTTLSRAVL